MHANVMLTVTVLCTQISITIVPILAQHVLLVITEASDVNRLGSGFVVNNPPLEYCITGVGWPVGAERDVSGGG